MLWLCFINQARKWDKLVAKLLPKAVINLDRVFWPCGGSLACPRSSGCPDSRRGELPPQRDQSTPLGSSRASQFISSLTSWEPFDLLQTMAGHLLEHEAV